MKTVKFLVKYRMRIEKRQKTKGNKGVEIMLQVNIFGAKKVVGKLKVDLKKKKCST